MENIYRKLCEYLKEGKAASEILTSEKDGVFYYALSPDRVNVIEWYPFRKTDKVLQAGVSYGVFHPLYERAGSWTVASDDGTEREYAVLSAGGDRDGFSVVSWSDVPEASFDIVIDAEGAKDIGTLAKYLKPEGKLLLIADNQNAPRFVTGADHEPGKRYLTMEEIDAAKEKYFDGMKLYYPLPDADFAKDIRDEKHAPGPGNFRFVSGSVFGTRFSLCDEEALYDRLTAKDPAAIRKYAPSYLCIYEKGAGRKDDLPGFIRYNTSRKPEYAIRTELYEDRVVKTALSAKANAHVDGFLTRRETAEGAIPLIEATLQGVDCRENADAASARHSAVFPLLKGENLGSSLSVLIRDGKAPEKEIETWLSRIASGEKARNLDLIFDNIFITKNGPFVIDYEWVSGEDKDPAYIRYRALRYWYEDNAKTLTRYKDLEDFLAHFGIGEKQFLAFSAEEDRFQESVSGTDREKITGRFVKPAVVEMKDENLRLRDEVDELKTLLKKERETERLSQQHIRNIESMLRDRDARLEAGEAELAYLRGHQTLTSRGKRAFIRRLDAYAPAGSKKRMAIRYAKGLLRHPGTYGKRFFTKDGKVLRRGDFEIGGEFPEGGILKLPECSEPKVSIIIPAYNQVTYTYACIRSILENTDPAETPYEVILADDASTDATANIGLFIKGLRVARTAGNLGFLKNCNNAAKEAKGEYIFFLNNDTKVRKNWLSSIVTLMDGDDSIGLAGSKLIFADGKLQEAGGIIWSDASGWNFGRNDDPDAPQYNYVKDVDYISGAAICIRRLLWLGIGGFDERYAPAYCEDSDLAFEVRHQGKRVVYQPLSEVVHFEGISNGTDVNGTGLKHYQVVNQEKFREKWAEELKKQEENTGDPDPFTARDRSREKKCILIVDHYVPTWDRDAGSVTTYRYIRMFAEMGWNVKFLGDNFLHEEPYATSLQQLGVEVLYGEELRTGIWDWIEKNRRHIDVAYLNRPHIAAKYIDQLKSAGVKCIFYGHDLHYLRIRREFELTGDIRKKRESDYWKSLEYEVMEKADRVYYPSTDEIGEIRRVRPDLAAKSKAIVAFIYDENDAVLSEAKPEDERKGFLFVGGFKHPPNADGALWFAKEVWPEVKKQIPEAEFYVAGSSPTDEIRALSGAGNGIEVLGFVPDEKLEELYRSVRVVSVPLRYGAGVKGKVTEALSRGSAIVTTSVGAEGIPEGETAMVITDEAQSFAKACVEMYQNEGKRAALRKKGLELIRKHYSTNAAWQVIEKDFR